MTHELTEAPVLWFPENLRFIRQSMKWSQKELAERLDITVGKVKTYETGKSTPSLSQILFFCCKLKINTEILLKTNMAEAFQPIEYALLHVNSRKQKPNE